MVTFRFHQYQVVGRALPSPTEEHPKIYMMKLWATNHVRAKSKFWYFLRKLKKVKKSNGQILAIMSQLTDMVTGSFGDENICRVAPARLWKAMVLDVHNLVPKLLPEIIASIDILKGDGGVGTVKTVTFGPAIKEEFTCLKERIDVIDDKNYVLKYTVLEGGLLGIKLKAYSFEVKVEATGEGGAKMKLKVVYETIGEGLFGDEDIGKILEWIVAIEKAIEGYLIQNPHAYT